MKVYKFGKAQIKIKDTEFQEVKRVVVSFDDVSDFVVVNASKYKTSAIVRLMKHTIRRLHKHRSLNIL